MSTCSNMDGSYPGTSFNSYQGRPQPNQQATAQWQPTSFLPTQPSRPTVARQTTSTNLPPPATSAVPKALTPRELRNRAEKLRRSDMSQSIARLATLVPSVVKSAKKVDKTSILRYAAHYLRSHRHVFGKSLSREPIYSYNFTSTVLQTLKGFLLTTTYKGLLVVVSPNIQQYLGYTELELLGQSIFKIVHPDDHIELKDQLYPRSCKLTTSKGELLLSRDENAAEEAAKALKNETRSFTIRFKKMAQHRSDPVQYIKCHVEGSFRKSDRAGVFVDNDVQIRRIRARGKNPFASGNDIVFIGMVRPVPETFLTERLIQAFKMEYRTRHYMDGGILDCDHRIALVTGYMINEVKGANAMNFMHRDDVKYVIIALRQMYVRRYLKGDSCYRLITRNGKFIYLQTSGTLEVDSVTNEVTSFVCTNTMVSEQEGIKLIALMKQKFASVINETTNENDVARRKVTENQTSSVVDPRQLEKVIHKLVTNLPPKPNIKQSTSRETNPALAIIPPRREQIKEAIEKSYSVIKNLRQLAPQTRSEMMESTESLEPTRTSENTPNGKNHPQPVPGNPQHIDQNPSQYGYYPQADFSSANNIPSTSGYIGPANLVEEVCEQREFNEVQATVMQGESNEQLVRYNNPNLHRLYGETTITYREDNATSFETEVAGSSNCSVCLNTANNNEENVQRRSTKETTDTNMNILANQSSAAANTLNGDYGVNGSNTWTLCNREISTLPQDNDTAPSTHDAQSNNNNINANGADSLELSLGSTMNELVEDYLHDRDLFRTAGQASQNLMNVDDRVLFKTTRQTSPTLMNVDDRVLFKTAEQTSQTLMNVDDRDLFNTAEQTSQSLMNGNEAAAIAVDDDSSFEMDREEMHEIVEQFNQIDGLNHITPVGEELLKAVEEPSAYTQQNYYYLEQPSQVNQIITLHSYEVQAPELPQVNEIACLDSYEYHIVQQPQVNLIDSLDDYELDLPQQPQVNLSASYEFNDELLDQVNPSASLDPYEFYDEEEATGFTGRP